MSADAPQATSQDSKDPIEGWLRRGLALAGLLGALLLFFATFATVIKLSAYDTNGQPVKIDSLSGGDRHGIGLVVFAIIALAALGYGLRGTRQAFAVLAAVGLLTLVVSFAKDAAHVHDTGSVGELYDDANAGAGIGFYMETLGAVLVLVSGGGLLLVDYAPQLTSDGRRPGDDDDEAGGEPEPEPDPQPRRREREPNAPRKPLDWFN